MFRIHGCNYFTCLNENCLDPLIAMEIVGHTDYQTTTNIYTRPKQETLRKSSADMEKVFASRSELKSA